MLPNVTTAEAVVMSSFEYERPRNRIILVEGEFPSVRYVYDRLARRFGAEVVTVAYDTLLETIDERTQIVPISHVFFESSFMIDVQSVARRCREVGATLVLDVFHRLFESPAAGFAPGVIRHCGSVTWDRQRPERRPMKLKLDLHDIYNRGYDIDRALRAKIDEAVAKIRAEVGREEVILGLSGGVDSSVAAALIHRAIGDQLTCIFVDTGLLRKHEVLSELMEEHVQLKKALGEL